MTAPNTPIVVNPSAIPDIATVGVRYAATLLAGWLIRKGYITDSDEPLVFGVLIAVATIAWAGYRAWSNKANMVTVARSAPDSVATVTEPTPPPSAA